jgi:hypothetical protein
MPAVATALPADDDGAADDALALLAAARAQLRETSTLDPGLANWAAAALDLVLARHSRQEAIALRRFGRRERDRFIRQLAAEYFAEEPSNRAKAEAVLAAARQYAAIGWLRHRGSVTCHDSIRGTAQELLWRAMKAHKKFPDSVSMVEKILARKE